MTAQSWLSLPTHQDWLRGEANKLFDYFQWRSINPKGGFFEFDPDGKPLNADNPVRGIHSTARMVHCMTIGHLLGRPGQAGRQALEPAFFLLGLFAHGVPLERGS